jgi:hypothetical protein
MTIFYQGYFEILLVVYLNYQLKINNTFFDVVSNLLGYFLGLCAVTFIPMEIIYVMYLPYESFKSKAIQKSFG